MSGDGNDASDVRASAIAALLEMPAGELAAHRADLQAAAQAAGMTPGEIEDVLNSRADLPRQLLPAEQDALLALLDQGDFPGRDDLLAQLPGSASACDSPATGLRRRSATRAPAFPRKAL